MTEPKRLHIPQASPAWALIMQSGVELAATVGLPLADFLNSQLELTGEQQGRIEALVLDGMPVDDPARALIHDGSRLALAAGLPGIAGLAMKKDSAVKALRGPITHVKTEPASPRPGRVTLALYSLVLPVLGPHFLRKGVLITPAQFARYARFSPDDPCEFAGRLQASSDLARELSAGDSPAEFFFTVSMTPGPDHG